MSCDHMFLVYFILFFVSLWGMFLFSAEIVQKWPARPSAVYLYVLVLLTGFTIILGVNVISRHLTIEGDYHILTTWYWPFRWYVTGIGIIAIVGHMTWRKFFERAT